MFEDVPNLTAIALLVGGCLLGVSCMLSRLTTRFGVPIALIFLAIGMLAGSDGPGRIPFDRFDLAYIFGTLALVVILYSGGFNTSIARVRGAIVPASVLATVGVVGIAGMTAAGAHLLGLDWKEALLVGAIMSSTDAAAVFSVLQGVPLRRRVGLTLELESGLNDPVAVILTTAATLHLLHPADVHLPLLAAIGYQLVLGAGVGVGAGIIGQVLLRQAQPATTALVPAMSLAIALVTYGGATKVGGSGFLAVYVAGILIGNGRVRQRRNLARVQESFAWLAQVLMFLMLGLLVFPKQLPRVAVTGTALAFWIAFVARPTVAAICLLPFRFSWREVVYISWVGLRGAVPIILATMPVMQSPGQSPAMQDTLNAFDLVFFVVVVSAIIPGATVRWATRVLGLADGSKGQTPLADPAPDGAEGGKTEQRQ